jgi:hypothetical protein
MMGKMHDLGKRILVLRSSAMYKSLYTKGLMTAGPVNGGNEILLTIAFLRRHA